MFLVVVGRPMVLNIVTTCCSSSSLTMSPAFDNILQIIIQCVEYSRKYFGSCLDLLRPIGLLEISCAFGTGLSCFRTSSSTSVVAGDEFCAEIVSISFRDPCSSIKCTTDNFQLVPPSYNWDIVSLVCITPLYAFICLVTVNDPWNTLPFGRKFRISPTVVMLHLLPWKQIHICFRIKVVTMLYNLCCATQVCTH